VLVQFYLVTWFSYVALYAP